MELPVSLQTIQLTFSVLLGICLGIHYDILRVLRGNARIVTQVLDFWFCLSTLLCCLLFALYVGEGEFRLFFFVGIGGGAALWFLTLSRLFRLALKKILRLISAPFRFLWRILKKFYKKIEKNTKNLFSSAKKWFMIKECNWQNARKQKKEKGGRRHAVSKDVAASEIGDSGTGGVRYRYADLAAVADPAGQGRKRGKAAADQRHHAKQRKVKSRQR